MMISHLSSSTLLYTTGRLSITIKCLVFFILVICHSAAGYDDDTDYTEDGSQNKTGYVHTHSNRLLSCFMLLDS